MNAQEAYKKDVYGFKINSRTRQGKINKVKSYNQIKELKNGVLLVRLKTREKSIAALEKKGNSEMAYALRAKQKMFNARLVESFRQYFTYCPVYFFYSDESKKVLEREFEAINFVSPPTAEDFNKLKNATFFTAEFGNIQQNITDYRDSSNQITYTYGSDLNSMALVIMDHNFRQLQSPFPFASRARDVSFELIQTLETSLLEFEKFAKVKRDLLLYRKNKK